MDVHTDVQFGGQCHSGTDIDPHGPMTRLLAAPNPAALTAAPAKAPTTTCPNQLENAKSSQLAAQAAGQS